ncbi:MAG: hypothetical protein WDZ83_05630 [Rhizobiaceae bacterium]
MELAVKLLLIIHLLSLVVGGATAVAMPIIARRMAAATPDTLATLGPIAGRLSINSRIAFGMLLLTGVAMLWLRYGGDAIALGPWFLAKLVLVGVVALAIALILTLGQARVNPRVFGMITGLSMLGIVICSVMTFG